MGRWAQRACQLRSQDWNGLLWTGQVACAPAGKATSCYHLRSMLQHVPSSQQLHLQVNGAAKQELLQGAQPRQRPGDRMARQMGEGLAGAETPLQHMLQLLQIQLL
jgi:hypothetical protein